MRTRFVWAVPFLLIFLTGCETLGGLTPIRTKVRFEGDAAAFRYALTGQEPTPYAAAAGPIEFEYETSADKALLVRMDEKEGSKLLEFESASDSQYAASSRVVDNARLQAQTEALTSMVTAVAAAIAASRAPTVTDIPPDLLELLESLKPPPAPPEDPPPSTDTPKPDDTTPTNPNPSTDPAPPAAVGRRRG